MFQGLPARLKLSQPNERGHWLVALITARFILFLLAARLIAFNRAFFY